MVKGWRLKVAAKLPTCLTVALSECTLSGGIKHVAGDFPFRFRLLKDPPPQTPSDNGGHATKILNFTLADDFARFRPRLHDDDELLRPFRGD